MILNNEFSLYDPLIVDLRNNFLLEASIILNEAPPYQKNSVQADAAWYIKWKGEFVLTLKESFTRFRQYATTQHNKYSKWLRDNREFFDARKYNPGSGCSIQSAPNYREAISRIKKPISVVINGEALNRIAIPGDTTNKQSQYTSNVDNRWFYKMLIPEYNGNGDDFLKYATGYYNGNDSKKSIHAKVMATYIPMMYNYCINYMSTVQILEGQLNTIIGFINRDPVSGVQNTSDDAVKQYQNQQQQNANNQYASTNANQNVVHASTDYLYWREASMILNELGSTAPTSFSTPQTNVTNTAATTRISNTINGGRTLQSNSKNAKNTTGSNGVDLTNNKNNQKQIAMKKKQFASNIVKSAFLAKLTASNNIYRDFITTLQVWAVGVQEQIKKANERTAKKQAKQAEKNQTKTNTQQTTQG